MFPFHDENKTLHPAYVTIALIAINVLVWLLVEGAGSAISVARAVCDLGLIPGELTGRLPPGTRFPLGEGIVCLTDPGRQISHVITSMFLHGSWMHLIGNMWFLWLFGNNVEDSMGYVRYVIFYLLCGIAAALAQVAATPASGIPMVGASGAISGVMGAYLVLYPRVRVYVFLFLGFFFTTIALPAWTMLLYWFALQFIGGLAGLVAAQEGGGVAFWAHAGGFVAGVVLIKLFARRDYIEARESQRWQPRSLRTS
jgi:membrane associated rhomboid family serine protease